MVQQRQTEAVCRSKAVEWTMRTPTAAGPDIRACCPGSVIVECPCQSSELVGWPSLWGLKENIPFKIAHTTIS